MVNVKDVKHEKTTRKSFSKIGDFIEMPNLIKVQKDSYEWFLNEGLGEVLKEVSPIEDYSENLRLDFLDYRMDEHPKYTIEEAKERDATYSTKLHVNVRLFNHETGEVIPEAVAVVDCKRKDNTYPFNGLAGCGVAFKLAQGISKRLELPEEKALKYLDIVCVGTISDIVPLEDENRTISKLGLRLLNQTKNPGLKALIESTGYKKIDSTAVSFGLAPRINACGRMGHEDEALKLFLTDNLDEARNLTTKLNEYNTQRQDIEKQIFKEAQVMMENKQEQELPCIVLGGQNWHHGVIGIVSSKITDMYSKPSLLLCFEGEDAKGSGRSVQGFDLHEALENCKENIKQFGGHSMAVGLTIESKKFNEFKKSLENYAKKMKVDSIVPIIKIDQKIAMGEISIQDIKSLELLEPYGEANKMPIFQINNVKIESIRTLSEGKHLKLTVKDENRTIDCIGFNLGNLATDYPIGSKIDIIGNLEINEFRGIENIQVNLKDIRHSI